jgi:hypothetical protein
MATQIQVLTGPVIAAGQSLSSPLQVTSGGIYRILMPQDGWTQAQLTFQLSYNGTNFYDVCDREGNEIIINCNPGSVVPLGEYLKYMHTLKIRSGTSKAPVIQTGQRTFGIVLDTKEAVEVELRS